MYNCGNKYQLCFEQYVLLNTTDIKPLMIYVVRMVANNFIVADKYFSCKYTPALVWMVVHHNLNRAMIMNKRRGFSGSFVLSINCNVFQAVKKCKCRAILIELHADITC